MTTWKVVPICEFQRLDVRPEDLLNGGDFRKCETYRGGGGYDLFPNICERRLGRRAHEQFVVQLYGCVLDCPYCYVTRSGVWGRWKPYTTEQLIQAYKDSGQEVFHLMGGSPAIYLREWPELLEALPEGAIFTSDLLLVEQLYPKGVLQSIGSYKDKALIAVDVKGVTKEDWRRNTRRELNEDRLWTNLERLLYSGVNFYLTFTNPDPAEYEAWWKQVHQRFGPRVAATLRADAFTIGLKEYAASEFVNVYPVNVIKQAAEVGFHRALTQNLTKR